MKLRSNKICLVFDESDEITNPQALRTRIMLDLFRRAKYKCLATGTTVRNYVTESYSQLELLYNNSVNMLCLCPSISQYQIAVISAGMRHTSERTRQIYPTILGDSVIDAANQQNIAVIE